MSFLPPDLHHRMVFLATGAPAPVAVTAGRLWRLFEAMKAWGMPYQLWAAHDATFAVVAIDREETLVELIEASAIDWLGEKPPHAPTHRFGAFNRREDATFADLYVCFHAGQAASAPDGAEKAVVPFYAEVRFGVGPETSPAALEQRFADVLAILRPAHAFVETAFQSPHAISETTKPHVGWATFVPERLGPLPKLEPPTSVEPEPGGAVVVATPGVFDDGPVNAAIRERVAQVLLPFLEGRIIEAAPASAPKPSGPRLAVPLYMQNPRPSYIPPPEVQSPAPAQPVPLPPPPAVSPSPPQPSPDAPRPRVGAGNVPTFTLGATRAAAIVWSMGGAHYVTGIAKVSFLLQSGWMAMTTPEPLTEKDQYYRRSTLQSLEDHSDMIPYLPRGEVFLRGTALVAEGQRARARLLIQRTGGQQVLVDKVVELRGDLDPAAGGYVPVPLRYELSPHDATANPIGRAADVPGDLPRIIHPKAADFPVGLGAISPYWPIRVSRSRQQDQAGLRKNPIELPADFSWDAFSAAPTDQRVQGFFQGTERIYLEGYHAKDRVIDAALPGAAVGGRVYFRDGSTRTIAMVADTIRIDLDRRLVSISFRGYVPSSSPSSSDIVFGAAVLGQGGAPPVWPGQVEFPSGAQAPAEKPAAAFSGDLTMVEKLDLQKALPFVDPAGEPGTKDKGYPKKR